MTDLVPVTVLTGYLGAGKTTLLNRILSQDHGRRYAVLVNEFGEIGIDGDLIVSGDEELFQMSNGCVCCTVRGDLIRTLHALLATGRPLDAIVIETTGLAAPAPVAQTFFVDPSLQARCRLDSVTTVVDARHVIGQLADSREAAEQIAFADQIVLNKIDLVGPDALPGIERRLMQLNPLAPIHRALRGAIDLDRVIGRHGFDLDRIVALAPAFLDPPSTPAHGEPGHIHDEQCADRHDAQGATGHHGHVHDSGITSVSLSCQQPMSRDTVTAWLTDLAATKGQDILRAKGIIDVAGEPRRLVFQAVHMLLEGDLQQPWPTDEPRVSRLVFIGRRLDPAALRAGFEACAAATSVPT